ncbi:hypothetical protein K1719_011086 [Acacia pycnantha]|nr:hypothetical protein K1719_011086 [Acacia pycnantha]
MYESLRLQEKLTRTFIRARVIIKIFEPLTTGFWVPRPHRDSIWVPVRYERLQNYCYDCGRLGHDSRNRKFQSDLAENEDADHRFGNGLGTAHVKNIEDALVVIDPTWDEAALGQRKPLPAAGLPPRCQSSDVATEHGESAHLSEKPGGRDLRRDSAVNGQIRINSVEVHSNNLTDETPKFSLRLSLSQIHPVEFPYNETDGQTSIIPFSGLSPISAVTSGLKQINLKRPSVPLDEDQRPTPLKKRLTFHEQDVVTISSETLAATSGGPQKMNMRKLKKSLRGKKGLRQAKILELNPSHSSPPLMPLDPRNNDVMAHTPSSPIPFNNTDGCHQAAIGSP